MKLKNIKLNVSLMVVTALCIIASGCYKAFDPSSYQPKFTISGFSSAKQIEPSSLVAYWAFEGSLLDSVSKSSGTNSATTFVNGFEGSAVSFDVANKSYFTFNPGTGITNLQSFTISFWVNPTFVDANSDGTIDGIIGLVNLSHTTDFWGDIDWFIENGSNNTAATLKAHVVSKNPSAAGTQDSWLVIGNVKGLFGSWTSHTLTYDATSSKLTYYINGSKVGSTTSSWGGPLTIVDNGPMVFGAVQFQTDPSLGTAGGSQSWASYLTGTIDEVRIYNKALSDTDINALVVLQGKGK
jgi:hypothetical protein